MVSSQPPSAMDFARPDITEEELNSEVELLRDEDLLKEVVEMAGPLSPATPPRGEAPPQQGRGWNGARGGGGVARSKTSPSLVKSTETRPEARAPDLPVRP